MTLKLRTINLLRWLKEYWISWGLLSVIYSLTVTLILQPILEKILKTELPLAPLWGLTCIILLLPSLVEFAPLGALSKKYFFGELIFGEKFFKSWGNITPLYLRHEMRRMNTWISLLIPVIASAWISEKRVGIWLLFNQLPLQRALYSIHPWRNLSRTFSPEKGAYALLRSVVLSQLFQALMIWIALGVTGAWNPAIWRMLLPSIIGGAITGASMALEGDSGRPWLVNFIGMTGALLGAYLCLWSPWCLILVGYTYRQMQVGVKNRFQSIEHMDEDRLIS